MLNASQSNYLLIWLVAIFAIVILFEWNIINRFPIMSNMFDTVTYRGVWRWLTHTVHILWCSTVTVGVRHIPCIFHHWISMAHLCMYHHIPQCTAVTTVVWHIPCIYRHIPRRTTVTVGVWHIPCIYRHIPQCTHPKR